VRRRRGLLIQHPRQLHCRRAVLEHTFDISTCPDKLVKRTNCLTVDVREPATLPHLRNVRELASLSMGERKAVTRQIATRYRKASRLQKRLILDELCALTGWHRDHARRALRAAWLAPEGGLRRGKPQRASRRRARVYDERIMGIVRMAWAISAPRRRRCWRGSHRPRSTAGWPRTDPPLRHRRGADDTQRALRTTAPHDQLLRAAGEADQQDPRRRERHQALGHPLDALPASPRPSRRRRSHQDRARRELPAQPGADPSRDRPPPKAASRPQHNQDHQCSEGGESPPSIRTFLMRQRPARDPDILT
jgi:hypothetical protein